MSKINIILEWDELDLGEAWMNKDNLMALLYSSQSTTEDLLQVKVYE